MSSYMDAIGLLPECLRNEEDLEAIDTLIDKVAANSRWTNVMVASALCRLLHLICGD